MKPKTIAEKTARDIMQDICDNNMKMSHSYISSQVQSAINETVGVDKVHKLLDKILDMLCISYENGVAKLKGDVAWPIIAEIKNIIQPSKQSHD